MNQLPVHPERENVALEIDADEDFHLSETEIMDYLKRTDALEDPTDHTVDTERVVEEFSCHLRKVIPEEVKGYHSYDEVAAELEAMATAHPDICERVSIGKTAQGRDIWALRISSGEPGEKPGVVITGCHHAREWMSMEAPLRVSRELCEGYGKDEAMTARVNGGEIWIIPVVNPDGYEYSRSDDNWWRKNRRPVEQTATGKPTNAIGTDLNRNYADPQRPELYRPASDSPGSTSDDFGGATSDNPRSDTYRGNAPASEPETKAMLGLELGQANIRGVLDHHGYGEMVLFPWGVKEEAVENADQYRRVGARMNEAIVAQGGKPFRVMQSKELYPTSGSSHDIHHANGLLSITLEIGRSFQPDPKNIEPITRQVAAANMVFIDEVLSQA